MLLGHRKYFTNLAQMRAGNSLQSLGVFGVFKGIPGQTVRKHKDPGGSVATSTVTQGHWVKGRLFKSLILIK